MLNRKIEAYKEDKTSLSCFDLCKELTKLKKHSEYIWLKEVTTESLKKLVCHCLNADIKGSLEQIGKSWKLFEHKGKPMTKKQVKCVLNYALSKGYTNTGQLTDAEVDHMITPIEF